MEYTVLLHHGDKLGYWGEVPALPGCYSQGNTVEETLANLREAILCHLEALAAEGEGPEPGEPLIIGRVIVPEELLGIPA